MSNTLECRFSAMINKRNSAAYPLEKAKFSFFFLFLFGCVLGAVIFNIGFDNSELYNSEPITVHIQKIITSGASYTDLLSKAIKLSKTDLSHVFFVFISGFTYFCFFASGAIVFAKGFMLGFSLAFLIPQYDSIPFTVPLIYIVVYCITKLISSVITALLAAETYVFSYDFRIIKQNCSILRRASVTYKFAFVFIKALGGCLLSNLLYCILIKLL